MEKNATSPIFVDQCFREQKPLEKGFLRQCALPSLLPAYPIAFPFGFILFNSGNK